MRFLAGQWLSNINNTRAAFRGLVRIQVGSGTQLSHQPNMYKSPGPCPTLHKPGVMVNACNPSTCKGEARGLEVQGYPQLQSRLEASLGLHETLGLRKYINPQAFSLS